VHIYSVRKNALVVRFGPWESVAKIEVERTHGVADDEKLGFFRKFRFITESGEIVEVFCTSNTQQDLEIVEIDDHGNWLKRRFYRPKR
jgi:hypothetical protein